MNKKFLIFTTLIILLLHSSYIFAGQESEPERRPVGERILFRVHSSPSGAEVYIDNKFFGTTPLDKMRAVKGKYSISIYKKGYIEHKGEININTPNEIFNFKLKPKPWTPKSDNLIIKYFIPFFSNLDKELKLSFFFSYRYHFPENHSLSNFDFEIETGLINMKLKYKEDGVVNKGETTLTIFPIAVNMHFNFFRRFKYLSPYIGFGAGVNIINMDVETYEKTSLTFALIAGINFLTHWPVSIQFEFRYMWLGIAKIPIQGTSGDPPTVQKREEYFFKGILISIGIVGRF